MQSLQSKQLKSVILHQITQLNKTNAQYYCLLKKLNQTTHILNETFSEKLESMKNDIKQKIKQLSHNIDSIYHCIDKKIGIVVSKIGGIIEQNNKYQSMIKSCQEKIKQLNSLAKSYQEKINSLIVKNQHLNNKNYALTAEIENINNYKKKYEQENTNTYDSMGSFQEKQAGRRRTTQSEYKRQQNLYDHLSPIKQPNTNSMIKQPKNFNVLSNKKLIKSEQNSFSSLLLRQQNQKLQNYNSLKQRDSMLANSRDPASSKLGFGCMPATSTNQEGTKIIIFNQMKNNNPQSQIQNQDDNEKQHRMSFLMQNLQIPPKSHRTFSSSNDFNQTMNSMKSTKNLHLNQTQHQLSIRQNNLLSSNKMNQRALQKQQNSSTSLSRDPRCAPPVQVKRYQI